MLLRRRRWALVLVLTLVSSLPVVASSQSPAQAAAAGTIKVSGTKLVDGAGKSVKLVGANRSGTEYLCQQGVGIFSGPTDQASIDLMKSWKMNMVRIPLNEHCWLGMADRPATTGANYRNPIIDYVNRLNSDGIYVILDLHFTGPGGPSTTQQRNVMPNRQYSVPFWKSMATTFKSNASVLFELYNEPHDIDWNCWRNGCQTSDGFQSAGMQELMSAVRSQGAKQPVIINGLDWGHDMREMLANEPDDSAHQLVAGQHLYNFKRCITTSCWDDEFAPVAKVMPLVAPEIGVNNCKADFVTGFLRWMDAHGGDGYGVWHFGTGPCPENDPYGGSALLSDWNGATTPYGKGIKDYYTALDPPDSTTTTTSVAPPTTVPPTSCPAGQFKAQYFNNKTMSGTPAVTRCEATIQHDWGNAGPAPGVHSDGFSARWTSVPTFAAGTYNFTVTGDDGIRLYIDNALVIDGWKDQAPTTYVAQRTLTAGTHGVRVEYYENGGGAVAKVNWAVAAKCTASQWSAQYFDNLTLAGSPAVTRCESTLDDNWGTGSPAPGIAADAFSARWVTSRTFTAGTHAFTVTGDDGIRLYIDNALVIDGWKDQPATTYTAQRNLTAGTHQIKVEFYERGGQAVARAAWV